MQKDIIRQIWDIRGLVDKAINNHNIELYEKARQQLLKIRENSIHLKSIAAETLKAEYESEEAREFDIEANLIMIIHNLNELRKDILGEEREEYELQFSSIAEILWYTRQMYDVFILNAELKSVEEDENKKLFFIIRRNFIRRIIRNNIRSSGVEEYRSEENTLDYENRKAASKLSS